MRATSSIACKLDARDWPGRLVEIASLGREALIEVERTKRRATLRFLESAEHAERLAALVAAESRCCAFLTFERLSDNGQQIVHIDAPEGGEAMLDVLIAAFGTPGQLGPAPDGRSDV